MIKLSYVVVGGVEFSIESDSESVEAVKKIAHRELKYLEESYFRMLKHEKALEHIATDESSSLPIEKNVHRVDNIRFHDTNCVSMHR